MKQDITRVNNSKWKKETDLLKSGLLKMKAGKSMGIINFHVDSKIFNSGNLHFHIDELFKEQDLFFLGKHWCMTYRRAVLYTNFSQLTGH